MRKKIWQLQEAKNRFSQVVQQAMADGPQWVTKRDHEAVVVLSAKTYREKIQHHKQSLIDFFKKSPLHGVDLDLSRNKDLPRELDL